MKVRQLIRHHKWFGIPLALLLLPICLSGIILNHPDLVEGYSVSRRLLPRGYHFEQWDQGLLRGGYPYGSGWLIYGTAGIWYIDQDSTGVAHATDASLGMVRGAHVRGMIATQGDTLALYHGLSYQTDQQYDGRQIKYTTPAAPPTHAPDVAPPVLWAVADRHLYRATPESVGALPQWQQVPIPVEGYDGRLWDITQQGDTIVVVGRSHLYIATAPYQHFVPLEVAAPAGAQRRVSLFRTIWMLHSGALWGMIGRLFVDGIAIILSVLSITGLIYSIAGRRYHHLSRPHRRLLSLLHGRLGRCTLLFTIAITITGWLLRPPGLLLIAFSDLPQPPGTTLHSPNYWDDKLRTLRYDEESQEWILHTSDGFYTLAALHSRPTPLEGATPPVSVMGITLMESDSTGGWVVGSFSGLYRWQRQSTDTPIIDLYTGTPPQQSVGPPVGDHMIAGAIMSRTGHTMAATTHSDTLTIAATDHQIVPVDYLTGTSHLPMPEELRHLPMPIRDLALEVHTGRIYTILGAGNPFFIFVIGAATLWCLWTGYKLTHRKRKETRQRTATDMAPHSDHTGT